MSFQGGRSNVTVVEPTLISALANKNSSHLAVPHTAELGNKMVRPPERPKKPKQDAGIDSGESQHDAVNSLRHSNKVKTQTSQPGSSSIRLIPEPQKRHFPLSNRTISQNGAYYICGIKKCH